ncbi:MAG TPA: hypothetical protein VLH56_11335 [Dissulfurispiraceae bacterium]|nr:hypothetical protein [Dissulfurispiraceae bacterium]
MKKKIISNQPIAVDLPDVPDTPDVFDTPISVDEVPDGWEKILTYCPTHGNVFRLRQIRPHRMKKTDE